MHNICNLFQTKTITKIRGWCSYTRFGDL